MKKILPALFPAVFLFLLMIIPVSCLKDKVSYTYTMRTPVLQTLTQVRANMKTTASVPIEYTGKIYSFGKYIFINEIDRGIHIIDNSDPSKPSNIGFLPIPGNQDLAVKGNTLYADAFNDLIAFDIHDPLHASISKITPNVFPFRMAYFFSASTNPDSAMVVVDWTSKDTTVDYNTYQRYNGCGGFAGCMYPLYYASSPAAMASSSSTNKGIGGSLAKFTIVNNYLYTLSQPDLSSFDITHEGDMVFANKANVDWSAETLYPFEDKLFVGASNGMYIYDIQSDPTLPNKVGQFTHARTCDPVVADGQFAYVTLSSGTTCQGFTNELDIVNIQDIKNASLAKTYPMSHPRGLGKDGKLLFICDDTEGLKVFDASDVQNLKQIFQFKDGQALDIIVNNGIAIVLTQAGLFEYDYSDINNIHLIGSLLTAKI